MTKTEVIPTRLLWVDLEMTGLDPREDLILEVALEVTDFDFKTLQSYESKVRQPKEKVIQRMQKNTFWSDFPNNRDEFIKNIDQAKDEASVKKDILSIIDKHFGDEPVILAGNSIHNDRGFIKHHWPEIDLRLHYRMLDVSSFKLLMQGKYSLMYEKKEMHRAFDDIQASIAELQYYLEWLSNKN